MWLERVRKELEMPAKSVLTVYPNYMEALGLWNWSRTHLCKIFRTFHFLVLQNATNFFFLFIVVAVLPASERAQAAWKHEFKRGKTCQLFSTMSGIIGIELRGFKSYQLWWFILLSLCFLTLLLATSLCCFLHLHLCELWHLKEP